MAFWKTTAGVILTASALVLSSCAADPRERASELPNASPVTNSDDPMATEDSLAVIPAALEFTSETLDGETVRGADYAGHAAVFWFWAPWCAVCQREAPNLADAAASYGDSVEFLGIAAQDSPDAMRGFVDQYGVSDFPHLNDADAAVWAKFGVTQQPAFAFLSESGELEVVRGTLSPDELDSRISELSG